MSFVKGFKKFSDGLDKLCIAVVVIMLAVMVGVTIAQIICRNFKALQWSEEVCRYLLIWTTFLGASCVYKEGSHITITFIQGLFPPKVQRKIRIFVHIVCILVFFTVVYYSFTFGLRQNQLAPSLRIPMKYMYMSIPIGFSFMIVHAVNEVLQLLTAKGGKGE